MRTFILFSMLTIASCVPLNSDAWDQDRNGGNQGNSWERQRDTQRLQNYDTYRNGPTVATLEQRRREERRQEEQERLATQRREPAEQNHRQAYGKSGGQTGAFRGGGCRGLYAAC